MIRVFIRFEGWGNVGEEQFEAPSLEVARATAFWMCEVQPGEDGEFRANGHKVILEYIFEDGAVYRERFLGTPFWVSGPFHYFNLEREAQLALGREKLLASWFEQGGTR